MQRAFLLCLNILAVVCLYSDDSIMTEVNLQEVVATGTRNPVEARLLPLSVNVVADSILSERQETNVLPTLMLQVPGLFVTQRGVMGYGVSTGGSGAIKIRGIGGSPNTDVLVLIDGLPQYAGLYGHPVADNYQTMQAERVEVVRGPASLYYGSNAMGGVLNIVTRQPHQDTVLTHLHLQGGSYYTFDAGASNQVKKGRFSSSVGFNYSRTGGHRDNMEFDQYSAYARLAYELDTHWNLNVVGNISHFNAANPGEENNPIEDNDMRILRGNVTLSAENSYDRTSGAVRVFYNGGRHQINEGYRPQNGESPQSQLYMHTDFMAGLSAYQTVRFFRGNQTTFGFDYQHFGGHAWYGVMPDSMRTDLPKDIIRKAQFSVAGYVDFRQQIVSWLSLDAGVRLDWHSESGLAVIPQAGLAFSLPKDAELKLLANRGFRNPTIRELYMYKPANDDLKPVSLWNYELSYRQYLLNRRLCLGVNIFYLHATNMIETRMVDGKSLNVNTGELQNAGAEAEFRYAIWKGLYLNANYSYLWMRYPQLAAPEHKLTVMLGYHHERFKVGSSIQYIHGLRTRLETASLSEVQQNFVLWNVHASVRVYKQLWANLKADNLLNRHYEINYGYPMPGITLMGGLSVSL